MKIRFGFNDSIKIIIPRNRTRADNSGISDKEYIMCLYGYPHEEGESLVNNFFMLRVYASHKTTGIDNNRYANGFNYDECYNRALHTTYANETSFHGNIRYSWNYHNRLQQIEEQARSSSCHRKRKSGIQIGVLDDSFIRL